ncbi:MAG: DMT family transporter [Nitriliruptoraceae bacterium]
MNLALPAAVFAGVLIAVQSAIIGAFGERTHPLVASTWVHVGGLALGVTILALSPRLGFEFAVVRQAPWVLLAGVAGLLLVTGIAVAVAGLGLASTLAVVTGVQLLVGFGLEASGLLGSTIPLSPARLLGALMLVVGAYLVVSRGPVAT